MFKRTGVRKGMPYVPYALKHAILRTGGMNLYREPLFRVVRAEDRFISIAGEWSIWAENIPVGERGSLGMKEAQAMVKRQRRPEEIVEYLQANMRKGPERMIRGYVDRPKYGMVGWILEKWKPAESWGSPADWYAYQFEGVCALGPYPARGDYEHVAGPTPYQPSIADIKRAIQENFRDCDDRPLSAAVRLQQIMDQMELEKAAKEKALYDRLDAQVQDSPVTICGNKVSLGARRVMNELQENIGIRSQYHA